MLEHCVGIDEWRLLFEVDSGDMLEHCVGINECSLLFEVDSTVCSVISQSLQSLYVRSSLSLHPCWCEVQSVFSNDNVDCK